ncbi:hypothetical protein EV144_106373 [Flavobacterium sp. 270]|uniref:hypothetical protein n=1 Tax=Flavobacterium sp. 270 TaxID=2512114 RepID=UPI001065949E|nr:hypothetical protein [Flavobacterium sp. 270]TDW46699.1 hypothetical protein EV144_106373 [Flavobacterium sp. 270]
MNIGIITYREYEVKNIGLNWNFNLSELLHIMLNNKDFVRFEIFDRNNKLLLSTYYPHVKQKIVYIKVAKIEKEKEITGITSDAFRKPLTIYRIKVRWKVNGRRFRTKKEAREYVYWENRRVTMKIESFVDRR